MTRNLLIVGAIGWSMIMLLLGGIAGVDGDPTPFPPFGGWLTAGMVRSAMWHFVIGNGILLGLGVIGFIVFGTRDRMG